MKFKKGVQLKAKNKRFLIAWLNDNTIAFETRTLQDWKKRIITYTSGVYSVESFILLSELFNFMYNDVDFVKDNKMNYSLNENSKAMAIIIDNINNPK